MLGSKFRDLWRRASAVREFNEGAKIQMQDYKHVDFKNDYYKLVTMFQMRLYHTNNTPYQFHCDKLTNDMAYLHRELNYLNSRIYYKRMLMVMAAAYGILFFLVGERPRDWADNYDLKFDVKAYGSLDDSSGEGNTEIDD